MKDVTQILRNIQLGDQQAAEHLLPVVYDELRKLASANMSQENPGQTLQATALVHEAYLRLVGSEQEQKWDHRGHFFASAAEAMRRILVEKARYKKRLKHGGEYQRQELYEIEIAGPKIHEDLIALDDALDRLKATDPQAVELVNLRYFVGLTNVEAAKMLEISPRQADRIWAFARAWLHQEISSPESDSEKN